MLALMLFRFYTEEYGQQGEFISTGGNRTSNSCSVYIFMVHITQLHGVKSIELKPFPRQLYLSHDPL